MQWSYPAVLERHEDGEIVVRFPDLPEVLTGGSSEAEALAEAADALEEGVLAYMAAGQPAPLPREASPGEVAVPLDPVTAARAELARVMREQRISNVELAGRLSKSEGAVRRLVDGATGVKIDTVLEALRLLNRRATLVFADA